MKSKLLIFFLFLSINIFSQGSFSYLPQNPKAGDEITIIYTLQNNIKYIPEAYVVKYKNLRENLFDIQLTKNGNSYNAKIKTDSTNSLLIFSFRVAGKWDNNLNKGFLIPLKNGNNYYAINTFLNAANFFHFYGAYRFGLKRNDSATIEYFNKEFQLYPKNKEKYYTTYLGCLKNLDSTNAKYLADSIILNISNKENLSSEDYDNLIDYYTITGNTEKLELLKKNKSINYPFNLFDKNDLRQFLKQIDTKIKDSIRNLLLIEINRNDDKYKFGILIDIVNFSLIEDYLKCKDWERFYSIINNMFWVKGIDLLYSKAASAALNDTLGKTYAKIFASQAVKISKYLISNPGEVPNYMTFSEMIISNKNDYGFYCYKYSQILRILNENIEALKLAKEAAFYIADGNNVVYNSNYASIASQQISKNIFINQLEKFVRDDKYDDNILTILKSLVTSGNTINLNYITYLNNLKYYSDSILLQDLKKRKIHQKAPNFLLNDLNGNTIKLDYYKGKTVVLDFWSTWCAPCIASFPEMSKIIDQYKKDTNVVFFFINTFQHEEDKINFIKKFIQKSKVNFNILLDLDFNVAKDYNVESIPVKYIINKEGYINFKSTGYQSDIFLKKEFDAMIKFLK